MSENEGIKIITDNRRARFEYFLSEHLEAGLVLTGSEVKSVRSGKVHLTDAYAVVKNNELWLLNAHISPYAAANRENHDPVRPRKLLVHRREISRLLGKTREKGLTLIPLKIYLKKGRIKCELALAKAKKLHDKRETQRRRVAEEEAREAVARRR